MPTVRVRMLGNFADFRIGEIRDLPEEMGRRYIRFHLAEPVVEGAETMTFEPARNTAKRTSRARGRRV